MGRRRWHRADHAGFECFYALLKCRRGAIEVGADEAKQGHLQNNPRVDGVSHVHKGLANDFDVGKRSREQPNPALRSGSMALR